MPRLRSPSTFSRSSGSMQTVPGWKASMHSVQNACAHRRSIRQDARGDRGEADAGCVAHVRTQRIGRSGPGPRMATAKAAWATSTTAARPRGRAGCRTAAAGSGAGGSCASPERRTANRRVRSPPTLLATHLKPEECCNLIWPVRRMPWRRKQNHPVDPLVSTWGAERRAEFSALGPRAAVSCPCLGSGLGLVGTASARR